MTVRAECKYFNLDKFCLKKDFNVYFALFLNGATGTLVNDVTHLWKGQGGRSAKVRFKR